MTNKEFKSIRIKLGYTQEEFAEKLNYSAPWVSMVESGKRNIINRVEKQILKLMKMVKK